LRRINPGSSLAIDHVGWSCSDHSSTISFLLTFALAEQEEIRQNKAAARSAYEDLIKTHGAEIDKLKTAIAKEVETAKGPEIEDEEVEFLRADDEDMEGAELSETQKRKAEREARGQAVIDRRQTELDDLVTAAGVIWIMQIRFARRTDVSAISGAFSHSMLTCVFDHRA